MNIICINAALIKQLQPPESNTVAFCVDVFSYQGPVMSTLHESPSPEFDTKGFRSPDFGDDGSDGEFVFNRKEFIRTPTLKKDMEDSFSSPNSNVRMSPLLSALRDAVSSVHNLEDYEIVEKIGAGFFAEVYKVMRPQNARRLAPLAELIESFTCCMLGAEGNGDMWE